MSVTSGFFNSIDGDRRYNAEQMSAIFDGVINDGILANIGTAFTVSAVSGNDIEVGIGRAWFNSTWLYNDAVLPITLDDSDAVIDRIDAVIIEINHNDDVRAGSIKVIKGTPSSEPERPALIRSERVNQYPLAFIHRTADSSAVRQADITSMIGTSSAPYVTGILQVQNIDNIVAQWSDQWVKWFESRTAESEADAERIEREWNTWFSQEITQNETDISSWKDQMKADVEAWFAMVQLILDGNTATELTNRVTQLYDYFETLALERTVYSDLKDSSGDTVLDSNGLVIRGRTVMRDQYDDTDPINVTYNISEESGEPLYKIGDICSTARRDLDNTWLLCNGAGYTRSSYPKLAELFADLADWPILYGGSISSVIRPVAFSSLGDYWVGCNLIDYTTYYHIKLAYGTNTNKNTNGGSIVKYPYSGLTPTVSEVQKDNSGKYFFAVFGSDSSSGSTATSSIYHVASVSHTAWSKVENDLSGKQVYKVCYVNGKYVAFTFRASSPASVYLHSSSTLAIALSSWSEKHLFYYTPSSLDTLPPCSNILYGSGYYVFAAYNKATTDTYVNLSIFYSTSVTGTWTEKVILNTNLKVAPSVEPRLYYIDNQFILLYHSPSSSNSKNGTLRIVAFKISSSGYSATVSDRSILTYENCAYYDRTLSAGTQHGYGLAYGSGYYAVVMTQGSSVIDDIQPTILYSTSLTSWQSMIVDKYSSNFSANPLLTMNDIVYHDGYFYISGDGFRIYKIESDKFSVPEISLSDDAYTYIKAKE